MKTYQYLYSHITSFDNLWKAAQNARKGKRFKDYVSRFEFQLERNLFQLQKELIGHTYQPGNYTSFMIHEPKLRMISAAPYKDRIVHHALMNIMAPIFEKTFIFDSYANRIGKGTYAAIERYQHYAKSFPYILKCDIQKFFPSIDHEILKKEIRWKILCKDTLWLSDRIIDGSNPQLAPYVFFEGDDLFTPNKRRKGLPIGNLTSQWWGNIYLNRLDHFIKEELRVPGYIRYVDDFVLFAHDKSVLHDWKNRIIAFLSSYRLVLHRNKTHIYSVRSGVPFLGFKVYPQYRMVLKPSVRRYVRYTRKKLLLLRTAKLSPKKFEHGLNSWLGHIRFGPSKRLEHRIFFYIRNQGVKLSQRRKGSWYIQDKA